MEAWKAEPLVIAAAVAAAAGVPGILGKGGVFGHRRWAAAGVLAEGWCLWSPPPRPRLGFWRKAAPLFTAATGCGWDFGERRRLCSPPQRIAAAAGLVKGGAFGYRALLLCSRRNVSLCACRLLWGVAVLCSCVLAVMFPCVLADFCGAHAAVEVFEARARLLNARVNLPFPTLSILHLIDQIRDASANAVTAADRRRVASEESAFSSS